MASVGGLRRGGGTICRLNHLVFGHFPLCRDRHFWCLQDARRAPALQLADAKTRQHRELERVHTVWTFNHGSGSRLVHKQQALMARPEPAKGSGAFRRGGRAAPEQRVLTRYQRGSDRRRREPPPPPPPPNPPLRSGFGRASFTVRFRPPT